MVPEMAGSTRGARRPPECHTLAERTLPPPASVKSRPLSLPRSHPQSPSPPRQSPPIQNPHLKADPRRCFGFGSTMQEAQEDQVGACTVRKARSEVERGGEREMMISLWARAGATYTGITAIRPRKVAPPERHPSTCPPAIVNGRIYSPRTTTSYHCDRANSRVLYIRPHRRRAPHPLASSYSLHTHTPPLARSTPVSTHSLLAPRSASLPRRPRRRATPTNESVRRARNGMDGRRVCSPVAVALEHFLDRSCPAERESAASARNGARSSTKVPALDEVGGRERDMGACAGAVRRGRVPSMGPSTVDEAEVNVDAGV
ncbi:hypothetical protein DFH08DRAFT_1021920 [Mycena albidolilacea]|uniref:Uncharacterized protein n=1 Tax=Mycena albidolilacea TaxID=1033008 RepID=A0AAD6ZN75_9AGAR|nr:hypothetical protein DFH08DRAFT_1021920 [Mycena albidolilacea]